MISSEPATVRISAQGHSAFVEIPIEVWRVDHVLLTPRSLEIELGKRKQILAEVTNDEAARATDVLLNWQHDADDQLIIRIHPTGWITGNRIGHTQVTAGAGNHLKVDGTAAGGKLMLGNYALWVDAAGNLRMKNGAPTSDTDGAIVGTQQ